MTVRSPHQTQNIAWRSCIVATRTRGYSGCEEPFRDQPQSFTASLDSSHLRYSSSRRYTGIHIHRLAAACDMKAQLLLDARVGLAIAVNAIELYLDGPIARFCGGSPDLLGAAHAQSGRPCGRNEARITGPIATWFTACAWSFHLQRMPNHAIDVWTTVIPAHKVVYPWIWSRGGCRRRRRCDRPLSGGLLLAECHGCQPQDQTGTNNANQPRQWQVFRAHIPSFLRKNWSIVILSGGCQRLAVCNVHTTRFAQRTGRLGDLSAQQCRIAVQRLPASFSTNVLLRKVKPFSPFLTRKQAQILA